MDYLKSSEINSELKLDLQALQEDLSSKFSHQISNDPQESSQRHRKISIGYQEEQLVSHLNSTLSNTDRKNILQQSNSLKTLYEEMTKALAYQNRGSELVSFLIANQKSSNKIQAVAILNAMIAAGFLVAITQVVSNDDSATASFDENTFYKLLRIDEAMSHSGSFQLDLDLEASSVHLSRPNPDSLSGWMEGKWKRTYTSPILKRKKFTFDIPRVDLVPQNTQDSFGFTTTKDFEDESSVLSTAGSKLLMESFCEHEELLLCKKCYFVFPYHNRFVTVCRVFP